MSSTPIANDLPMLGGASFSAEAPAPDAPAVSAPAPADAPAVSDLTTPVPELSSVRQAIEQAIGAHKVILFMKGTPESPACGFSARTVAALQSLEVPFAAVDVLPDPRIRQELSAISNWPTIPQLFANGELVGGCDIVTEMYESGELAETLQ
jgi:monothiol glutaredoxin